MDDFTYGDAFKGGGAAELWLEMMGDAADEIDGKVGSLVRDDVAAEEGTEIINDQLLERFTVDMLADELRSMGQITVWHGLPIDFVDDVGEVLACVAEILFTKVIGKGSFEECADKETSQNSPAALIAKDESKRRNILDNLLTIIKA